jgi:4-hydroxy-tetrahydrodipicolinate reductase
MTIRVCVAGATGWTGSAVTRAIVASSEFQLVGAIARRLAGRDIGEALGQGRANVNIAASLEEALAAPTDVLIDYTDPDVVKNHILAALDKGVRVVVGTSGLTASDFVDIEQRAKACKLGVIAAGNFSITAALAKHFALIAAHYLPSWEIIDYASAEKIDAPSGTTRELAEELATISQNLCWLLGTSVQEIGILHAIEHASLPKHVRREYNQHRPFCSYSLARCLFSRRRGSISWVVCSL